jgi:hypothetical protein
MLDVAVDAIHLLQNSIERQCINLISDKCVASDLVA